MLYVKICVKITFGWCSRFKVLRGFCLYRGGSHSFCLVLCFFMCICLLFTVHPGFLVGFIWFHGYLSDFQGFWLPVCFWKAKGRKQDIKKKP